MNGIHHMGGMHGFGRVEVEADEPVFHARWEARVFGMSAVVLRRFLGNIDARRHGLERLDPVTYLANGYYGRWLARLEREPPGTLDEPVNESDTAYPAVEGVGERSCVSGRVR
jgi:hypothetical protein